MCDQSAGNPDERRQAGNGDGPSVHDLVLTWSVDGILRIFGPLDSSRQFGRERKYPLFARPVP